MGSLSRSSSSSSTLSFSSGLENSLKALTKLLPESVTAPTVLFCIPNSFIMLSIFSAKTSKVWEPTSRLQARAHDFLVKSLSSQWHVIPRCDFEETVQQSHVMQTLLTSESSFLMSSFHCWKSSSIFAIKVGYVITFLPGHPRITKLLGNIRRG